MEFQESLIPQTNLDNKITINSYIYTNLKQRAGISSVVCRDTEKGECSSPGPRLKRKRQREHKHLRSDKERLGRGDQSHVVYSQDEYRRSFFSLSNCT